jgi:hypothetical protein
MGSAKAASVQQAIAPHAVRAAAVAAWANRQSRRDIRAFYAANMGGARPRPVVDALGGDEEETPYVGAYSTHALTDALGGSVQEPSYTAIACSPETRPGCEAINAQRLAKGWQPLAIYECPLIPAAPGGGGKMSSTALRAAAAAGRA